MTKTISWIFWGALALHLACVTILWLPSVHYFFDAVAIRDTGTIWSSLTWSTADKKHFLPAAILMHYEGVLQFLILNGYYALIGDLLPLKPSTTQLPNVVLALWAGAMAFSLGSRLHSRRCGFLFAAVLVCMPWLAVAARLPWVFNLLSMALQLTCLRAAVAWTDAPSRSRARFWAAASVALFLLAAPDWPAFLAVLAGWYLATGMVRPALTNRYIVLPLAVVIVQAAWTVAVYRYGAGDPARNDLYQYTFLLYPFMKVGGSSLPAVDRLPALLWAMFGVALPAALAGVAIVAVAWRTLDARAPSTRGPDIVMAVWLVADLLLLVWHGGSITYGYVVAIPMAWYAARALLRVPVAVQAAVLAALIVMQWSAGPLKSRDLMRQYGDDRRVLAAAAFLNRERPDLLGPGKTALLPRPQASNVGQYARGQNRRIIMDDDYPVTRQIHSVGSPESVLGPLVEKYLAGAPLGVDWLILTSEQVGPSAAAPGFFRRLLEDPGISWIAAMHDDHARSLWIGEVKPGGANRPAAGAQQYPVAALADDYERTYDRIAFLRRNARYVDHY
jgi:hypothetical protein